MQSMSLELPKPIARYLAAVDAKDADMLALCFSKEAVVHDEGGEYLGLDAIKSWGEETQRKYKYAMEALDALVTGNIVRVRAKVTGSFPGSPVELDYLFTLTNDKIISLQIEQNGFEARGWPARSSPPLPSSLIASHTAIDLAYMKNVECPGFWQGNPFMNELFEPYPFLRVLSKCTHLDYSSLLVPQGPLSASLGHFDSIHRCHSIVYQTCKDARIPLRAQLCRYLQPACLKAEAVQALHELESSLPNDTAIVAYAAPLQIRVRA